LLVTVPVPVPLRVTVSVGSTAVNAAFTFRAWLIVTTHVPVPVQPSPLQPPQGRVERPLLDPERPAGNQRDPLADPGAVRGLPAQGAEDQQLQGAAEEGEMGVRNRESRVRSEGSRAEPR